MSNNNSQHAQAIDALYSFYGDTQEDDKQAPVDLTWLREEIAEERHLLLIEQQHSSNNSYSNTNNRGA